MREKVLHCAKIYFPPDSLRHLSLLSIPTSCTNSENTTALITLPHWASDLGVGEYSSLLIPAHCICEGDGPNWQNVDWWRAAFEMMTNQAEYQYEQNNGSVHSYASRLPKIFFDRWNHAWVNRIILFIRRWAAFESGMDEEHLFGKLQSGKVHLTHDVDYVKKTFALRFKQSVFSVFNIIKSILKGNLEGIYKNTCKLIRFVFGSGEYWQFENIVRIEAEYGLTSTWNFYGGVGGFKRSFTELILDPAYRVSDEKLSVQIRKLKSEGNSIGLHQGFYSWRDSNRMFVEKKRIEESLNENINTCRQHWLRFSFADSWKAQEKAGFKLDSTLGFNERVGFRNSAALRLPAWIASEERFSDTLETLPMVLMDSHLFDYGQMNSTDRKIIIDNMLDEIAFVGGEATVIWHQRVFHADYNWGDDYRYLLEGIKSRGLH